MLRHLFAVLTVLATILVTAALGETLPRVKNADQMSYHVEMWRYAKLLKRRANDPSLSHRHVPNASAELQNVRIATNAYGMRGPEPQLDDRDRTRILLLGSSITLGWGVAEEHTLRARLEASLGGRAQVWNAGVGNYNAHRYVRLFETELRALAPDIVVVQYFVNDAEVLPPALHNWLIEHSQLALMLWQFWAKQSEGHTNLDGLIARYRDVYAGESAARVAMEAALTRLARMAQEDRFRVVLAMTPDIHRLQPYPFDFIHDEMQTLATRLGWTYVDLLPALRREDPLSLHAISGDPHPNGLGHALMSEALLPVLQQHLN